MTLGEWMVPFSYLVASTPRSAGGKPSTPPFCTISTVPGSVTVNPVESAPNLVSLYCAVISSLSEAVGASCANAPEHEPIAISKPTITQAAIWLFARMITNLLGDQSNQLFRAAKKRSARFSICRGSGTGGDVLAAAVPQS